MYPKINHQRLTQIFRLLLPATEIQSGPKLTSDLISTLSRCPSDFYLLINQPGVDLSDFSTPSTAPTLSDFLKPAIHSLLRSCVLIPEVAGEVDTSLLEQEINSRCGAWSTAIEVSGSQIGIATFRTLLTLLQEWLRPSLLTVLHRYLALISQRHGNRNRSAAKTFWIMVGFLVDYLRSSVSDEIDRPLAIIGPRDATQSKLYCHISNHT
jgi:hypothetical protein